MPNDKPLLEWSEGPHLSKRVPKHLNGKPFVREEDVQALHSSLSSLHPHIPPVLKLQDVEGDPNSQLLVMHTTTFSQLQPSKKIVMQWLQTTLVSHKASQLKDAGRDFQMRVDPQKILYGVEARQLEDSLFLVVSDRQKVDPDIRDQAFARGDVVLLDQVDGVSCQTLAEFHEVRAACVAQKRLLRVRGRKCGHPHQQKPPPAQQRRAAKPKLQAPQVEKRKQDQAKVGQKRKKRAPSDELSGERQAEASQKRKKRALSDDLSDEGAATVSSNNTSPAMEPIPKKQSKGVASLSGHQQSYPPRNTTTSQVGNTPSLSGLISNMQRSIPPRNGPLGSRAVAANIPADSESKVSGRGRASDACAPALPAPSRSVVSIMGGSRGNRQSKRGVKFKQENEKRQYVIGSKPYLMSVVPRDPELAMSPPRDDPEIEKEDRMNKVRHAIETETFVEVLKLFEEGAASEFTSEDLMSLRQSISDRRGDRDFSKKDIILKVFLLAIEVSRQALAVKRWTRFHVSIERIECTFDQTSSPGLVDVEMLMNRRHGNTQNQKETLFAERFDAKDAMLIPQSPHPHAKTNHNPQVDSQRILEIRLKRQAQTSWETCGSVEVALRDLYIESVKKRGRPFLWEPELSQLDRPFQQCKVVLGVQRKLDPSYQESKRLDWVVKLNSIIEWIHRFNLEMSDAERDQCMFSMEVPLGKSTLLHSAVVLGEESVVQLLRKHGAIVHPSILIQLGETGDQKGIAVDDQLRQRMLALLR